MRPYVKEERLRFKVNGIGRPRSLLYLQNGVGYAVEGDKGGRNDFMKTLKDIQTKIPGTLKLFAYYTVSSFL